MAVKNICQHQKKNERPVRSVLFCSMWKKKKKGAHRVQHIEPIAAIQQWVRVYTLNLIHWGPNFNGTNKHWIDSFSSSNQLLHMYILCLSLCCLVSFFALAHADRFSLLFFVTLLCDACAYNTDFANRIQSVVELPRHGKIHIEFYIAETVCAEDSGQIKKKSRADHVHMIHMQCTWTNGQRYCVGASAVCLCFCLFVCLLLEAATAAAVAVAAAFHYYFQPVDWAHSQMRTMKPYLCVCSAHM